jgi:hypothetical protein
MKRWRFLQMPLTAIHPRPNSMSVGRNPREEEAESVSAEAQRLRSSAAPSDSLTWHIRRKALRFSDLLVLLCFSSAHVFANAELHSTLQTSRLILQTSPLAGFQHHAGRVLFPFMQVGDTLVLQREPANPHDPQAVRVEWRGVQIGYAPRADNVDLARLMDRGTRVEGRILNLQKGRDPWKRVLMELYVIQPDER